MNKDIDAQFLCKDCSRYNLCEYYDRRKKDSYICKYFHLSEMVNGQQSRWIPVSERLPESGRYAVTMSNAFGSHEPYTQILIWANNLHAFDPFKFKDERGGWVDYDPGYGVYFERKGVIAWMPLPEPMKDGADIGRRTKGVSE